MFNFILSVFHVVVLPHEKRFAGFRVQFICSIDDLVQFKNNCKLGIDRHKKNALHGASFTFPNEMPYYPPRVHQELKSPFFKNTTDFYINKQNERRISIARAGRNRGWVMQQGFVWQLHVFIVQRKESRCNSEGDDISAITPPTGITICSSQEHRERKI